MVAKAYLFLLLIMSTLKISATIYAVGYGKGVQWTLGVIPSIDMNVGRLVDIVWMIFNAMIPLLISYIRMKNEGKLKVEVSHTDDVGCDSEEEESAPLTSGTGASSYHA